MPRLTGTPVRWPRALWDAALEASDGHLARLCPLCPDPGTRVTFQGTGSFNVPINYNADGFTVTTLHGGAESSVVWRPCGHTVTVEGLDPCAKGCVC